MVDVLEAPPAEAAPAVEARRASPTRNPLSRDDPARRRFTIAVCIGIAVVVVPMLWLLCDNWNGSFNLLRGVPYDNFYDLQARSMFSGHLNIPKGYMGIEAFIHDGKQYTYFGLFPSLLRMPVLLVTHRFDGELTAPSLLLSWCTTAVFTSLLLWRVRILTRGRALLGYAEATSYGILMAAVMGGSVVVFLMATPFIYNEDFAWSIALTTGTMFALLGVMERPGRGRVWVAGILVLFTALNRTPTGYACIIGAFLVAGWFLLKRGGPDQRRWWFPMALAGAVPFLVMCLVTQAKFGIPIGLPMADQVWASVNAHRRYFLEANGGKAFSFSFLPTTLFSYLQPFGIRISRIFPFVNPPGSPVAVYGGAVMDQLYPTASAPPTMPLIILLSIWGVVAAFRRRPAGSLHLVRIVLVVGVLGTTGVFLWGYVATRYLGDLMPFFILAGCVGMVDLWRWLGGKARGLRNGAVAVAALLAAWGIFANVAVAASPVTEWNSTQAANYIGAQLHHSLVSLTSTVHQGPSLPAWAPAGQIFIAGQCSGLYLSNGDSFKNVPGQQIQRSTWIPVERGAALTHLVRLRFHQRTLTAPVTLLTYGPASLVMRPAPRHSFELVVEHSGTTTTWPSNISWPIQIKRHNPDYILGIITDPNMHLIEVDWYGQKLIGHYVGGDGPAVVRTTATSPGAPSPEVRVTRLKTPAWLTNLGYCKALERKA